MWGSLWPLCPAWQLLLWLLRTLGGGGSAPSHPPPQLYLPTAAGLATGPKARSAPWKGPFHKPFPALPVPPGTPSPFLVPSSPGLISVSRLGLQRHCFTFFPMALGESFSHGSAPRGSALQRLGGSRKESEPVIQAETQEKDWGLPQFHTFPAVGRSHHTLHTPTTPQHPWNL